MGKLTDLQVKNALPTEGKFEVRLSDGDGLVLLVRRGKKGITKSWLVEYPQRGKVKTETIGTYETPRRGVPLTSLAQARVKAEKFLTDLESGVNPIVESIVSKLELALVGETPNNFQELSERWLEKRAITEHKDKGAEAGSALRRHVYPYLGALPLDRLRKGLIEAVLVKVHEQGFTRTCGILLSHIRHVINYGVSLNYIAGDCTVGIKVEKLEGRGQMRQRYLNEDELKLMHHLLNLSQMNARWKHAFWLVLATGNRADETLKAETAHIDLQKRVWFIPSANQKHPRGKPPPDRFVDLSDFAISHLKALLAMNPGKYLFPKDLPKGKPAEPASEGTLTKTFLARQTQRSSNRAGRQPVSKERKPRRTEEVDMFDLPGGHWTMHDVRRTFSTIGFRLKSDKNTIDKCLSHTTGTILQRTYIIDEDRRKMIEFWTSWGQHLERLVAQADEDERTYMAAKEKAEKYATERASRYGKLRKISTDAEVAS